MDLTETNTRDKGWGEKKSRNVCFVVVMRIIITL